MAERRDFGTIRKLPSGRYQATFVGPDLARHKALGPLGLEPRTYGLKVHSSAN